MFSLTGRPVVYSLRSCLWNWISVTLADHKHSFLVHPQFVLNQTSWPIKSTNFLHYKMGNKIPWEEKGKIWILQIASFLSFHIVAVVVFCRRCWRMASFTDKRWQRRLSPLAIYPLQNQPAAAAPVSSSTALLLVCQFIILIRLFI